MKSKGLDNILTSVAILSVGLLVFFSFSGLSNIIEIQSEGIPESLNYVEGELTVKDKTMKLSDKDEYKMLPSGSNAFDECLIAC